MIETLWPGSTTINGRAVVAGRCVVDVLGCGGAAEWVRVTADARCAGRLVLTAGFGADGVADGGMVAVVATVGEEACAAVCRTGVASG